MTANDKIPEKFSSDGGIEKKPPFKGAGSFDRDFFDDDWEVFVVKRDKTTGKPVGKLACCALARV